MQRACSSPAFGQKLGVLNNIEKVKKGFKKVEDHEKLETYLQHIMDWFTMYIYAICPEKVFMSLGVKVIPLPKSILFSIIYLPVTQPLGPRNFWFFVAFHNRKIRIVATNVAILVDSEAKNKEFLLNQQ